MPNRSELVDLALGQEDLLRSKSGGLDCTIELSDQLIRLVCRSMATRSNKEHALDLIASRVLVIYGILIRRILNPDYQRINKAYHWNQRVG